MNKRKEATRRERIAASRIGAVLTAGSGAPPGWEGDGRRPISHQASMEHKYTRGGKYRLTIPLWEKFAGPTETAGELPIWIVEFVPERLSLAVVPAGTAAEAGLKVGISTAIPTPARSYLIKAVDWWSMSPPPRGMIKKVDFTLGVVDRSTKLEIVDYGVLAEALMEVWGA